MLRHVIALVFMVLVVLASVVYYYYSQHSVNQVIFLINESVESRTTTPTCEAWYDGVALRVNYTVIDDPEILSLAKGFIKAFSPLPAGLNKNQVVNWLNANIAVLRITVELINNGDKPVYYVTNAFCEVCFNATICDHGFEPITWRVGDPIALLRITAEEGDVFPLMISCMLDLKYKRVAPRTSIVNEFYYIVTKLFRGTVRAIATICPKPFSNECREIQTYVPVYVASARPLPYTKKDFADTLFSNKTFVLGVDEFLYNVTVVMSNNMSIAIDRNGYLTIYLENRGSDRVYENFSWIIHGYRLTGFPTRFMGVVEPKSRAIVYRVYLPTVFNSTGEHEVTMMSSKVMMFNISMSSYEEVLKLKELAPRITPILRIECDETKPDMCRAILPKYSLYLKVSVRLKPEKLESFRVIKKPSFIDVEILRGIDEALKLINDSKTRESFIEQRGGRNVTVIALYINNGGDKNLTIVSWGGYIIHIVDVRNGSSVCGYGIITQILKPNIIVVKPKERKLFSIHIIEYREGELYIDGYECGKVEPGVYIIKMSLRTKPGIYVEMSVKFGS